MGFMGIIVLALAILSCADSLKLPKSGLVNPHILGGEPASIKDFPYQVSLRQRGTPFGHGHICGASILDDLHVLTAAHCVPKSQIPTFYYVVANSTKLDEVSATFRVENIAVHDQWKQGNPYQFDVAVIKLKDPLVFTETTNIKTVPLVPVGEEPAPGSPVVVAGWGRTKPGNRDPNKDYSDLMKLELQIVDKDSCDKCLGGTGKITTKVICAGMESDQKKDASVGDSGGPLVDLNTGMQVGIVSFGAEKATLLCPGAYTNLADSEVRQFIDKALQG